MGKSVCKSFRFFGLTACDFLQPTKISKIFLALWKWGQTAWDMTFMSVGGYMTVNSWTQQKMHLSLPLWLYVLQKKLQKLFHGLHSGTCDLRTTLVNGNLQESNYMLSFLDNLDQKNKILFILRGLSLPFDSKTTMYTIIIWFVSTAIGKICKVCFNKLCDLKVPWLKVK